jgi:hypothetical protein
MNQNKIADAFNNYFLSIADSVTSGISRYTSTSINNPIIYLADVFNPSRRTFKNHGCGASGGSIF